MSHSSETPNNPVKATGESMTSGMTKFPGSGASELPPLPKGKRVKSLGRSIIFGIVGTGAGALVGLLWAELLIWGLGWTDLTIQWLILWMIVGFIAGVVAQPARTLIGAGAGAISGTIIGTLVPLLFGQQEFMQSGMAVGLIIGAMTGAYMGELRRDRSA